MYVIHQSRCGCGGGCESHKKSNPLYKMTLVSSTICGCGWGLDVLFDSLMWISIHGCLCSSYVIEDVDVHMDVIDVCVCLFGSTDVND